MTVTSKQCGGGYLISLILVWSGFYKKIKLKESHGSNCLILFLFKELPKPKFLKPNNGQV